MSIIDRVKYDGPAEVLVWRHPPDDLSWGTQVIVNQSQEAVFFKGGQALDVLGPGTHTLHTANVPLLRSIISAPFGGRTPFAAEIYFVNKAAHLDVKWGTKPPIPIQDPKFGVFVPIRAFGQFGVQIQDSKMFVSQISGTLEAFTLDALSEYFRGALLARAKDYIAQTIINRKIGILEISAHLEEMSQDLNRGLAGDFARFGVLLLNFYLDSVDVPDDDDTVVRLKKALADRAEFDILGSAYNTKRTFDTLEKAAGNEGGGAGAGMSLGMGLGAGSGIGGIMAGAMGQSVGVSPRGANAAACPFCSAPNQAGARFCASCGKPLGAAQCPKCRADVIAGAKFCASCGEKLS
ncbi:MAG: SPFH domain-containing protein [Elusimicrobiota bacterium]